MNTDKFQYHPDQTRTDRFVFLGIAIVVALLYVLFMNQPLYGDGYGYGYNSAKWMVENNLQLCFIPGVLPFWLSFSLLSETSS